MCQNILGFINVFQEISGDFRIGKHISGDVLVFQDYPRYFRRFWDICITY